MSKRATAYLFISLDDDDDLHLFSPVHHHHHHQHSCRETGHTLDIQYPPRIHTRIAIA